MYIRHILLILSLYIAILYEVLHINYIALVIDPVVDPCYCLLPFAYCLLPTPMLMPIRLPLFAFAYARAMGQANGMGIGKCE